MSDSIALRGIRAWGRHGANPGERDIAQPIDVDCELECDLRLAAGSDALADTLDYAALHAEILSVVETHSYALLERLAQEIATRALRDMRVRTIAVTVGKPKLLDGATPSITIRRDARKQVVAALGLGSNVGDPATNVAAALDALSRGVGDAGGVGTVIARSCFYRSEPWGIAEQAPFVNAVALVETSLEPRGLLAALQHLERELGRIETYRWGPRVIDLDILTYGDLRVTEGDLVIPHARLYERAFALVPLAEIDPTFAPFVAALSERERASVVVIAEAR